MGEEMKGKILKRGGIAVQIMVSFNQELKKETPNFGENRRNCYWEIFNLIGTKLIYDEECDLWERELWLNNYNKKYVEQLFNKFKEIFNKYDSIIDFCKVEIYPAREVYKIEKKLKD
jgi:hypothetical protein